MDAGIGPSTPDDLRLITQDGAHCIFYSLLHGQAIWLPLPTDIRSPDKRCFYKITHTQICQKVALLT